MSIGPASPSAVPELNLSDRLRLARRHAGLTQEDLKAQTGISLSAISSYERGHKTPGKPFLLLWAQACGVDLDWLLTGMSPARRERSDPDGEDDVARVWGWENVPLHKRRVMASTLRETRAGRAG